MTDIVPIRPIENPGEPTAVPPKTEIEEVARSVAVALQDSLPEGCSFALFIYKCDGSSAYISSGSNEDVDAIITRWRAKVFNRPEPVDDRRFPSDVGAEGQRTLDVLYNLLGFRDADRVRDWIVAATNVARSARAAIDAVEPGRPKPGDRRYSKYFKRNIELVTYTDDSHWTFRVDGAPAGSFLPNQTPWSKMPPAKE